jgi:hypothetical protein
MTSPGSPDRCFVLLPGQPRGRNVAVCERGRLGARVVMSFRACCIERGWSA